jgi:uncharacterized DUF497 family protein
LNISYTKHAEINIKKRNISNEIIENVILNFAFIEKDKYDDSLIHYIGKIQDKFLRVIVRQINNEKLLIISAFFDRRIKGKI